MFVNAFGFVLKMIGLLWLALLGGWVVHWWDARPAGTPAIHLHIGPVPIVGWSIPVSWTAPMSVTAKLDAVTVERDALAKSLRSCSVALARQNDAVTALGAKSDRDTANANKAFQRALLGRRSVAQQVAAIAATKAGADEYAATNQMILDAVGGYQ